MGGHADFFGIRFYMYVYIYIYIWGDALGVLGGTRVLHQSVGGLGALSCAPWGRPKNRCKNNVKKYR